MESDTKALRQVRLSRNYAELHLLQSIPFEALEQWWKSKKSRAAKRIQHTWQNYQQASVPFPQQAPRTHSTGQKRVPHTEHPKRQFPGVDWSVLGNEFVPSEPFRFASSELDPKDLRELCNRSATRVKAKLLTESNTERWEPHEKFQKVLRMRGEVEVQLREYKRTAAWAKSVRVGLDQQSNLVKQQVHRLRNPLNLDEAAGVLMSGNSNHTNFDVKTSSHQGHDDMVLLRLVQLLGNIGEVASGEAQVRNGSIGDLHVSNHSTEEMVHVLVKLWNSSWIDVSSQGEESTTKGTIGELKNSSIAPSLLESEDSEKHVEDNPKEQHECSKNEQSHSNEQSHPNEQQEQNSQAFQQVHVSDDQVANSSDNLQDSHDGKRQEKQVAEPQKEKNSKVVVTEDSHNETEKCNERVTITKVVDMLWPSELRGIELPKVLSAIEFISRYCEPFLNNKRLEKEREMTHSDVSTNSETFEERIEKFVDPSQLSRVTIQSHRQLLQSTGARTGAWWRVTYRNSERDVRNLKVPTNKEERSKCNEQEISEYWISYCGGVPSKVECLDEYFDSAIDAEKKVANRAESIASKFGKEIVIATEKRLRQRPLIAASSKLKKPVQDRLDLNSERNQADRTDDSHTKDSNSKQKRRSSSSHKGSSTDEQNKENRRKRSSQRRRSSKSKKSSIVQTNELVARQLEMLHEKFELLESRLIGKEELGST